MTTWRPHSLIWIIVIGAAALIVILANAHLIYVATTTQPQCVAHVKGGEQDRPRGSFSAAKPSC